MNNLQRVFSYQNRQVRTIIKDGEPWFVAKDVCEVLDISKYRDATIKLDNDERSSTVMDTPGGHQEMTIINEPGLYSLILVASRKPEAKKFKRWVTHEVIPAIRKTGAYIAPASPTEALLHAVQILAQQEKKILALEASTSEAKSLAADAHHRIDSLDAVNVVGDARQRLNRMVQKYARQKGVMFNVAWHEFKGAFNISFHTNLELLILNFEKKTGLKNVTIPQYLAATGKLEDGIRVADKILNQAWAS